MVEWKINFAILKLMNNKVTQLSFGLFGSVLVKDEMKGYYDNVDDTKRKESKPQTSHVLLIIKRNLVFIQFRP